MSEKEAKKPKGDKPAKGDKKGDDKKGDKPAKGDKKGDDKKGGDKKGKGDDKKAEKPKEEKKEKAAPAPEKAAEPTPSDDKAADAGAGAAAAADGAAASADAAAEAAPAKEPLDPTTALKQVLLTSLHNDGLARGLHESVKALDRREAHLCVLSSGCNEPAYTKLITALCSEHQIPLIKVEDSKDLGEWVGLARRNAEGRAVKVVGCSCAVIRSWGEETEARQFIMEHIKAN